MRNGKVFDLFESRREFLQQSAAAGLATRVAAAPGQLSVLILIADQFRFDCLGANGNAHIRTPNLDALAAESAVFDCAYVQAPVCVPSRVTLLTGRYPHSHKNRVNYTPCDPREVFLQRRLQEHGYQTASAGKLHYYPPTNEHAKSTGFDYVELDDGVSATDPYSDYVAWRVKHDPRASVPYQATAPGARNPFRGVIDYEYTPTHWTGEESVRLLRQLAGSPRPFFLHCSFFKPHSPYTVPPPYDSLYDNAAIALPPAVSLDQIKKLPLPVQEQILRFVPAYGMDRTRLEWIYRSYYASVSMVDYEMGRILKALEDSGRSSSTIVIFTSDHGAQLLEHGLLDKNVFFEASVHVPLVVRLPGQILPGRYSELVGTIDILPTVLELCGLPIPACAQGRSFAPLVTRRGSYDVQEAVFAENVIPEVLTRKDNMDYQFIPGRGVHGIRHPDAKMVRTRRWKLNWYPGHSGELYDVENDPGEERNLWGDPAHAGLSNELRERLLNWMITADEADQIAPKWLL